MLNSRKFSRIRSRQRGASAVEFGIIAVLFFTLFFGIVEFGRFFYLYNTVQEVTRCAARAAAVTWKGDNGGSWENTSIPQQCLFGQNELVAGWEIHVANVRLRALNLASLNLAYDDPDGVANPKDIATNLSQCVGNPADVDCIRFVEASVQSCDNSGENCQPIQYQPMFGLIPLQVGIPNSTVRMPAESLGYQM